MGLLIEGQRLPIASLLAGTSPESVTLLINARRKQCALELLGIFKIMRERENPLTFEVETVFRSLSSNAFTRVWSTPGAYLWARISFGLVRASHQDAYTTNFADWLGTTTDQLLPQLVNRLWLYALTGLMIDQRHYRLSSPIPLVDSGTLPSLGLAWRSSRPFQLVGVNPGGLELIDEDGGQHTLSSIKEIPHLEVIQQPKLTENATLYLDVWSEHALASFKGVERGVRVATTEEVIAQTRVVKGALQHIGSTLPGVHEEMERLLQTITPLRPLHPGLPSSSNSAMTGGVWYTATEEPALVAEMLIHEHSHNKLFLVQDIDPLVDPERHGTGWEDCSYYSPWRDDPRPLNGIFHGYYVFSEAAQFWALRLEQSPPEKFTLRRFGMLVRQLQQARTVLEENCTFTPTGAELMRLLGRRLDEEFIPSAAALGTDQLTVMHMESNNIFDVDPDATIAAAIRSHRLQWDRRPSKSV